MLSAIQPPLPLLDRIRHDHLCEAFESSPRYAWAVAACVRGLGV